MEALDRLRWRRSVRSFVGSRVLDCATGFDSSCSLVTLEEANSRPHKLEIII